jgi:hypothetical protein
LESVSRALQLDEAEDARLLDLHIDWETVAHDLVAALRGEAGRNPYDRDLADLVGQLSV